MSTNLIKLIFSLSIMCLAGSLAYLGYAILVLVHNVPDVMDKIQMTSEQIKPVIEQTEKMTSLMPEVLHEVKLVREQIPPVLAEVKATRESLPPLIAEWQKTRADTIPKILKESSAIRSEIPSIIKEAEGYRELIPEVLIEVQNVQAALPDTLTRVEGIVTQAQTIASTASENAVTGLFTGILKAPFQLLKGMGNTLFRDDLELTQQDYNLVESKAATMLANAPLNEVLTFYSDDKTLKVALKVDNELYKGERLCRSLSIDLRKNRHRDQKQLTACRSADNHWTLE